MTHWTGTRHLSQGMSYCATESEDSTARSGRPGRKSQAKKTTKKKNAKKPSSESQAKSTVSNISAQVLEWHRVSTFNTIIILVPCHSWRQWSSTCFDCNSSTRDSWHVSAGTVSLSGYLVCYVICLIEVKIWKLLLLICYTRSVGQSVLTCWFIIPVSFTCSKARLGCTFFMLVIEYKLQL